MVGGCLAEADVERSIAFVDRESIKPDIISIIG